MITPQGQVEPTSTPLTMDANKKAEMVAKGKELLTEPMPNDKLSDLVENYYIFTLNEHYTSAQLKEVVEQIQIDLTQQA